ncbi:hypothetical protein Calkr_2558 [Caldicellulosiruptor acetigenus I77R1B]|uniref:CRISPR system Cms protein Csm4 n=1 Tax=Caldicellulosiruptor acetigenus (strain ATCC 700853 / DSM 12137 / I77R1B) TaxID=632335 RepID=E4S8X8_CALA7|nr:hypothetical protein [Caldicellulosiruptor acetigenus]ADQ41983.1 hypothetical protein Calkr_2558 [Caldicellulosiruptor acetigenus I77R1B]
MKKMNWYRLIFMQKQPIHVGSFLWGVVNETNIFIPGWTMWGALTNQFLKTNKNKEIEDAKKIFERITNFYPAIGPKETTCSESISQQLQYLFPQYEEGNFGFKKYIFKDGILQNAEDNKKDGFISEDEFKFEFVDTIISTAVEPLSRKAKDESLHEFEFILPMSKKNLYNRKNNEIKQLYWVGLIGFENNALNKINKLIDNSKNNSDKQQSTNECNGNGKKGYQDYKSFLEEVFSTVFIGGDVRYGYGELKLCSCEEVKSDAELNHWNINIDNGTARISSDAPLRQYLKFSNKMQIEGEIKLIAEFDFTKNVPSILKAGYFVNVGSKISHNVKQQNADEGNGNEKNVEQLDLSKYQLIKGKFEKID